MEKRKIKDLFKYLPKAKHKAGEGLEVGEYPFYTSSAVVNKYFNEYDYEPNKLIFATGGSASVHYADSRFAVSTDNFILEPNDGINAKYVYYYLKSNIGILQNGFHGAGLQHLSKDYLNDIDIPIISPDQQQKIVDILDKADEIRTKKRLANDKLDEFLKSTFIDMFDVDEYDRFSLNDISLTKGEYGSGAKSCEYVESLPRYVRITDINDNGKLNNKPVSPLNETNIDKYVLKYGDILFARTGATVGKTYLYSNNDGWCIYAGYCIRFKLNTDKVSPRYIFAYTQTNEYEAWVKSKQRVVAQPNINAKEYGEELLIPIPPIELQNKFANLVEKVEAQKQKNELVIEQMDNLFNSLSQQAFKGEL